MVRRGDVIWVDMGDPLGSEPGQTRPAVVVSSDSFNLSSMPLVVVCPLTSNLSRADYPATVELPEGAAGLPKSSVALAFQIGVVARRRLSDPIGALPLEYMWQVDQAIRVALDL